MRRFIFSALVLSAVTANAQVKNGMVGINTDEPRATMHIEPGVSESKGLIIPRITAAQMVSMSNLAHFGADHHAIITYLKETLPPADRTGKLVDVADPGYYYYDNTTGVQKWKTFGGGAEQDFKALPTSVPGFYNYLTKGAGIGSNGSSLGTGHSNIGIGAATYDLPNSTSVSGDGNIALGRLIYIAPNTGTMSGSENTAIGAELFQMSPAGGNIAGQFNMALGRIIYIFGKANAQFSNTANQNIGIGRYLFSLQNGDFAGYQNIGLGNDIYKLDSGNMDGNRNIGIGQDSYIVTNGDITNTAKNNISLGTDNYKLTNASTSTFSGQNNIGIGNTLYNLPGGNLTGQRNIGMGNDVFRLSTGDFSGNNNIGIGSGAMQASGIAGDYNIALGYESMNTSENIAGRENIAIGYQAIHPFSVDIGSYNIGIGNFALFGSMGSGNANIQLGNWAVGTPIAGRLNNVVAIGNEMNGLAIYNTDSNTILLGIPSYLVNSPKIGMGTYQPKAKLHVKGQVIVGDEGGNCTSDKAGAIRFDGTHFYGCDGSTWKQLDN